ncbi:MAG: hypothetical protein WA719_01425 [Thermoplasmata archaeon]
MDEPSVASDGASDPARPGSATGQSARVERSILRSRGVLGIVVVIIVVVLLVVFFFAEAGTPLSPIPRSFALTVSSDHCASNTSVYTFPSGASVQFTWGSSGGGAVTFTLYIDLGQSESREAAASGADAFAANGNPYWFVSYSCLPGMVSISGSYPA